MRLRLKPFYILAALSLLPALTGLPQATSAQSGPIILAGFPTLRQQHTLTCEASAASMGTRGSITESQLMVAMGRNPNPNLGFRGNPDGEQGNALVDYGVYAAPLSLALQRYGYHSEPLYYSSDAVIKSYINRGWPVVVWVPYALQPSKPRLLQHNGVPFVLVLHEHALLVVGYDNHTIFANDPWNAKVVRYFWRDFNRGWGYFGNMALAMEPCLAPQPVDSIGVTSLSTASITWTWPRGTNAASYDVTVTRVSKHPHVIDHQVMQGRSYTLPNPTVGATYQVAVRSENACGVLSAATTLYARLPAALPTPTPTPTSTPPPVPTTTGTVVATPSVETTNTPVVTRTPKP